MSKFTDITVEKFDALRSKNITLLHCPKCGNPGGKIVIDMPMYGKDGVYCECYQCGFKTKRKNAHILIVDKRKRMSTPVIDQSLISAIRQAVNDFNRKVKNIT